MGWFSLSHTPAAAQSGVAAHLYLANRSMERRAFVNADGELLLVPQQGATASLLDTARAELSARLPAVMVPQHLQLIERFPRLANGKIDRKALSGLGEALERRRSTTPSRSSSPTSLPPSAAASRSSRTRATSGWTRWLPAAAMCTYRPQGI